MMKVTIKLEQMAQENFKINPARVRTPQGFRRMKKGEKLREGDLFLYIPTLTWMPVHLEIGENYHTNCIRPIRLLSEHCS